MTETLSLHHECYHGKCDNIMNADFKTFTFNIGRCLVILDLVSGLWLGVVPQDLVDGVHGGQLGHRGHLRGAGHHSGGIKVVLSSLLYVSRPLTSCPPCCQSEIAPDHRGRVSWELGSRRTLRQSETSGGAEPIRGRPETEAQVIMRWGTGDTGEHLDDTLSYHSWVHHWFDDMKTSVCWPYL